MTDFKLNYPKRLHVELTSRCNFRCITCRHGFVNYGTDMPEILVKNIINELLPYASEIEMQGTGESLLSNNFQTLFDATKQFPNIKKILITNASLLSNYQIEDFVRSNMELVVSLDGSDYDSYRLNRPTGNFEKIIDTLIVIGEKKKEINNSKFSFIINMVATRENYYCIMNLINLAKNIGVDFLHVSEVRKCMPSLEVWNRLKFNEGQEREAFEQYIQKCKHYSNESGLGFSYNSLFEKKIIKRKICVSPWQHVFIGVDGQVKFCCELNYVLGNLMKNNFEEIWNGEKAILFRNKMIEEVYHSECMKCCLPWGIMCE